jgi:hypothetical protein
MNPSLSLTKKRFLINMILKTILISNQNIIKRKRKRIISHSIQLLNRRTQHLLVSSNNLPTLNRITQLPLQDMEIFLDHLFNGSSFY